jgi:Na+/H+ antiporter NhaD/arsenite permease-like protein
MDALAIAVLAVFVGTYLVISTEKVNRTGMSLLGMTIIGVVFWAAFQLGYENPPTFVILLEHVEWGTIMFVTAMMIIVAVAGGSGVFQFLALTLSKPSRGVHKDLYRTFLIFVFVTSLFLDTTSTMLIMAPLTIQVCKALDIDFKPYLISEAIVCNFASIPSIVGAVPNLVIAGETNLDAGMLFIIFMPLAVILLLITLPIFMKYYEKEFGTADPMHVDLLFRVDPATMIKSRRDFYASVIGFGILVLGFALGPSLQIQPSMIALMVASALLILAHDRATAFLSEVGWSTVFFLVGLFGLVSALELTGIIDELGVGIAGIVGDNPVIATVFMIWIPAILSAFLDNLPVSAVLAPIANQFTVISPVLPLALVFAVNIGGYIFTPLGSPANMVAIGFSEREGNHIAFIEFVKIGTLVGLIHLAVGTGWLLLISFFL